MTFVDPIGDMITRIRNAQMRSLSSVIIPSSKFRVKILDILKKEGYISGYKFLNDSKEKNNWELHYTAVIELHRYFREIQCILYVTVLSYLYYL